MKRVITLAILACCLPCFGQGLVLNRFFNQTADVGGGGGGITHVDSTSNSGSAGNPTVAVPAGVQSGDIVLLVASNDGSANFEAGDWPTGFTELDEDALTGDGAGVAIGWKRLTGADSGTYDFGNILGSSPEWVCQAIAFRGGHATDPPVISASSLNNANNANPITVTANGVTAVEGDALAWVSFPDVRTSGIGNGHTPPTNYTEAEDAELGWVNLSIAYRLGVSAGATGTVAGTFNVTATGAGWGAWLVRIPKAP